LNRFNGKPFTLLIYWLPESDNEKIFFLSVIVRTKSISAKYEINIKFKKVERKLVCDTKHGSVNFIQLRFGKVSHKSSPEN